MSPSTHPTLARAPVAGEIRYAAHLRELNLERVLAVAMDRPGPFTRAELIEATGLSAPTVGTLALSLIRSGLLTDLGTGPSRGGRRPSTMELNTRYGFVAAIHLGPARTWLAVADLRGEILERRAVETPQQVGPAALLSRVAAHLRQLLRDLAVPTDRLLAIGSGAPGVVDRERGMVVALAPNLNGWSRVPMGTLLRRALKAPVLVENDVNLAILGEHWHGAARGHDNCAFITIGTGIGAGIMIGGRLHHGHHYLAGEIALMCMAPEYVETDFGSRGCLESLAGLRALSDRWSHSEPENEDSWVGALLAAAKSGDPLARKAVHETMTLIGMAIANLSVVLDPSMIVVGGPLFSKGPSLIEDVRRIVSRIVPMPAQIVVSALGEEAPLIGSLLVASIEARERLRRQLRNLDEPPRPARVVRPFNAAPVRIQQA
jgi:predicted NBD/HSP70 family sugar kinase